MSTLRSQDRVSLCSFTFVDGRQCRTPRASGHPHLCYFHARRESQARAADQAGRDISACLSGGYVSACDLSAALGHLFAAVAQGQIQPRTAIALAYLGQTLVQSIHIAEKEYINAFGANSWRRTIRASFTPETPSPESVTRPAPNPQLTPTTSPKQSLPRSPVTFVESTLAKLHENKQL